MKSYLVVTGLAFALLFAAHVARVFAEGWQVASGPMFAVTSLLSLAMCGWSIVLLRRLWKA